MRKHIRPSTKGYPAMVTIIANMIVEDDWGRVRWFTTRAELPEFPKVGERVWLRINEALYKFRTVKRWEMNQGKECIEFDFKRPWFSWSSNYFYSVLTKDLSWTEFHREGIKKILVDRKNPLWVPAPA